MSKVIAFWIAAGQKHMKAYSRPWPSVVLVTLFLAGLAGFVWLEKQIGGPGIPDTAIFYDEADLAVMLPALGSQKWSHYYWFRMFDLVFPALSYATVLGLIGIAWRKACPPWMVLLPFLLLVADYLENVALSVFPLANQELYDGLLVITPFLSAVKWLAIFASILAIAAGVLMRLLRRFGRRAG